MISKLPDEIISKISAGEVITSPFNVVKECIENSIDANSSQITISVSKNCLSIRISDNGEGIEAQDFALLCERNCTSKLNEDLLNISTFGFRGEALASVSLISKIVVESKKTNQITGNVCVYNECKLVSIQGKAMNNGTNILISDLFYNHPYRKEYFSKKRDEMNRIYYLIANYSICYTNIKFIMYIDDNLKEDFNMKFKHEKSEQIFSLFSHKVYSIEDKKEIIQNVYKLDNDLLVCKNDQFLILNSNINCGLRQFIFILFINGRNVQNITMKERIKKIYSQYLLKNRYPFVYIEGYINHNCVDVNVHPSKKEVIFDNENCFIDTIINTIKDSFCNNIITTIENRNVKIYDNLNEQLPSQILYTDPNISSVADLMSDKSILPKYKKVYKLKSLDSLKNEYGCTDKYYFMKDMVFVGNFDHRTIVQDGFNMLLFDIDEILYQYFYQRILFEIGNNKILEVEIKVPVNLSGRHISFLSEYFNTLIVENVLINILSIDRIDISNDFIEILSDFANYEMLLEKETFSFLINRLSLSFAKLYIKNESSFNILKKNLYFKDEYTARFKIITSIKELYKLFERC